MQVSDAELIRKARQGNQCAYQEMVDEYGAYLYRLAISLVGNNADAEDVVQETFSGAFRNLKAFEQRASLKTWFTRILVRQAGMAHRSRRRRKVVALIEESHGTDRSVSTNDLKMDLNEALQCISSEHREVIVLREMQGMTYDEIAAALDVPRGTVESRLFRARRELRAQLKDYMPPNLEAER